MDICILLIIYICIKFKNRCNGVTNFCNIVRLEVSNNAEGQALIEGHNFCNDFETVIGLYNTEERAKEVLEEIVDTYKFNRCYAVGQKQAVYQMK